MGRIFADKAVRGIDRRFFLMLFVVGVNQVEARLFGRIAERVARGQGFIGLDGGAVTAFVEEFVRLLKQRFRAGAGLVAVPERLAAAGEQRQRGKGTSRDEAQPGPAGGRRKRGLLGHGQPPANARRRSIAYVLVMTGFLEERVPDAQRGQRLDLTLAQLFPDFSRTRLKAWIEAGHVLVDGAVPRPRDVVRGGEVVRITPRTEPVVPVAPESIALDVVYADAAILVIAKPPGLVVHPGAGNPRSTLQNALLGLDETLAQLPRAGIVHRLDKDTSGLLVVARTPAAHLKLTRALAGHEVEREYEAVAQGVMTAGGTVEAPIDRHPTNRLRMAVRQTGREAVTHYRVVERFRAQTHIRVHLETGRTHQIRVHMTHIGYPLVGDPLYGRRPQLPRAATAELVETMTAFRRQALHARRLTFKHPVTGKKVTFEAPLPPDFVQLLEALRADVKAAGPADPRLR